MIDYIEELLDEQETQSYLRGMDEDGDGEEGTLSVGGGIPTPHRAQLGASANSNMGGQKADEDQKGAKPLVHREGATPTESAQGLRRKNSPDLLEIPVPGQKGEQAGFYQESGTGNAHRLFAGETGRLPGAGKAILEAGGQLGRRLQWSSAAAAYRTPMTQVREQKREAEQGLTLLALDAAVQRDTRRYDGEFEFF